MKVKEPVVKPLTKFEQGNLYRYVGPGEYRGQLALAFIITDKADDFIYLGWVVSGGARAVRANDLAHFVDVTDEYQLQGTVPVVWKG